MRFINEGFTPAELKGFDEAPIRSEGSPLDPDRRGIFGGYESVHTDNPPTLARENGELVVRVTHGGMTISAPVGDGRWFFSQVVEMLVDPALVAAYPRDIASPND